MKSNIFIPKTINVGYQNRSGTYTGKLAYVIYYDEKCKLRKETSWNSWRDHDIPNDEFDNVPTSGFVLNKKVGDYSNGWDHRMAYCRIYDPRNFEFEITFENLLYILENCNSIKGKGLEGEFVYGWDEKDLVLLPVESPDYKTINEYNEIVHNNQHIKARDLIVGATYLTKDNEQWIYMGKHEYFYYGYEWVENGEVKRSKKSSDILTKSGCYSYNIDYECVKDYSYGKYFWFAYRQYDYDYVNCEKVYKTTFQWRFKQLKSIPKGKIIKCIDEKCSKEYADIYEAMEGNSSFSPYDSTKDEFVAYDFDSFMKNIDCKWRDVYFYSDTLNGCRDKYRAVYREFPNKYEIEVSSTKYGNSYNECTKSVFGKSKVTLQEIYEKMSPEYKKKYLRNGREYKE